MTKPKVISVIRPTEGQRKWLDNEAKRTGNSEASIIRGLIQEKVDRQINLKELLTRVNNANKHGEQITVLTESEFDRLTEILSNPQQAAEALKELMNKPRKTTEGDEK